MKNIKNFDKFISESITNLLTSKPNDEIIKKPIGYMTYRILKFVSEHPEGIRRKDLIKMIFDIKYEDTLITYDTSKHSRFYSSFFSNTNLLNKTGKGNNAKWYINANGLDKLKYYEKKFKDYDIEKIKKII